MLCGYFVVPRHRANSRRRRNAPAFMLLMKGMVTDILLLLPAVLAEKYPEKSEGFLREGWATYDVHYRKKSASIKSLDWGQPTFTAKLFPGATTVCASNMGQNLLTSLFSAQLKGGFH